MPLPDVRDVHVDQLLSQLSIAYTPGMYIAERVCPLVPVNKQSDKYLLYDKGDWLRDDAKLRAPGTVGARGGYRVDTSNTYFCDEYVFGEPITSERLANQDDVFQEEQSAVEFVTERILLRYERLVAAEVFVTGKWGTDLTLAGTNQWNDQDNSDPYGNIETGMETVRAAIGRRPNVCVLGAAVFSKLRIHPDTADRIKYTGRDQLTADLLASLISVDEVLVGGSVYESAKEEGTESIANVWGKSVLLAWRAPRPSVRQPSGMYGMAWVTPNGGRTRAIRRYDKLDQEERSIVIEASTYVDVKVTSSTSGYFIAAAVA